jgi:hypothetical protein
MQLSSGEIAGLLVGVASVGFNVFQLYKERVTRAAYSNERRALQGTFTALWQALDQGGLLLSELEHKGADARALRASAQALLHSQLTHVEQTLDKHFDTVPPSRAASAPEHNHPERPTVVLIDGVDAVTTAMVEAVEQAERYIFVVGGRSRNDAYLNALKQRANRGDVRYVRVLTGDHIRYPLCVHLHDMWGSVELGYLPEDKYGGILVTDSIVILALQSSRVGALDKGLRLVGESIASDYRVHVLDLLKSASGVPDLGFVRSLCKSCRSN